MISVSVKIYMYISSFIQSGQQIIISVKHASSKPLTADGATAHTGECYVAVTGHWIIVCHKLGRTYNWRDAVGNCYQLCWLCLLTMVRIHVYTMYLI